jgi:hypothetical protein
MFAKNLIALLFLSVAISAQRYYNVRGGRSSEAINVQTLSNLNEVTSTGERFFEERNAQRRRLQPKQISKQSSDAIIAHTIRKKTKSSNHIVTRTNSKQRPGAIITHTILKKTKGYGEIVANTNLKHNAKMSSQKKSSETTSSEKMSSKKMSLKNVVKPSFVTSTSKKNLENQSTSKQSSEKSGGSSSSITFSSGSSKSDNSSGSSNGRSDEDYIGLSRISKKSSERKSGKGKGSSSSSKESETQTSSKNVVKSSFVTNKSLKNSENQSTSKQSSDAIITHTMCTSLKQNKDMSLDETSSTDESLKESKKGWGKGKGSFNTGKAGYSKDSKKLGGRGKGGSSSSSITFSSGSSKSDNSSGSSNGRSDEDCIGLSRISKKSSKRKSGKGKGSSSSLKEFDIFSRRNFLLNLLSAYGPFTLGFEKDAFDWLVDVDSWQPSSYIGSFLHNTKDFSIWLDRYRLAVLYLSTNGQVWTTATDWLSPCKNVCEWFGVACDEKDIVVGIYLGKIIRIGEKSITLLPK